MKKIQNYIVLLTCLLICEMGLSQDRSKSNRPDRADSKATKLIPSESKQDTTDNPLLKIVSADTQLYDATGDDERFISIGNVRITHDSVYMFCEKAVLINGTNLQAIGDVSIIKNDTITIFADSLNYQSDSLMAYFVGNVVLEDGDQKLFTSFLQYDLEKDWAIYSDTALLVTDDMTIKSKRGIFHLDENYVNFYEKVTIEGTDFDLLSDSLRYYTELKRADFLSPTLINQGSKRIYSEGGYYDMDDKKSEFYGNAQFVDGDKTSTADTIRNNDQTKVTELIGNADYRSKDEVGRAEKIIYRVEKDEIELLGNGYFKNPENEVTGDIIFFNQKNNDVKVSGRSVLSNPPMIIIADDLDYQKDKGLAFANGNVIWKDTSSNYEIICDHARYIDSTDYMKAYNDEGKPILKNEVAEGDTLFLSGDTLISYTVMVENDSIGVDTHRYFQAYANVEMITDQMQSICDSLIYNGQDSIFTLYRNPMMWADSSQYNGDTIVIMMESNEIKQLDMNGAAMIISTEDFKFFDQIKGKIINAYFATGNIDRMRVTGGSEVVYYMKDEDKAYMGVNKTACTNMLFIFEDGDLLRTNYYKAPISTLTPMDKADHEAMKLGGFKWLIDKRPLTIDDLLF